MLSYVNWNDYDLEGNGAEALKSTQPKLGRVVEETMISYKTMGITAASVLAVGAVLALKAPKLLKAR